MASVSISGGSGDTLIIPFVESDNVSMAASMLQALADIPAGQKNMASVSGGLQAGISGQTNVLIDDVAGPVDVPVGYQYLIGGYVFDSGSTPVNSFVASGLFDGAQIDSTNTGLTYRAGTGATTVVAGGNLTIGTLATGGGSGVLLLDGPGTEKVTLSSGNWSVTTGTGFANVALGTGSDTVTAEGYDTIRGGTGAQTTVNLDHGQDSFIGGAGVATVVDQGDHDSIQGGAGRETVFAQGSALHIQGGGAEILLMQTGGGNTVVAGTSGIVAFGGDKGSLYQTADNYFFLNSGGGDDTINAAAGARGPVVFGAADGRVEINAAAEGSFAIARDGNETIDAAGSTASVVFFAGAGNSNLIGGSGSNYYCASTGDSTMSGGVGNIYEFINGREGGVNVITDFTQYDHLYVAGFGLAAGDGIQSETVQHGMLDLTLTDGTQIQFQNLSSAAQLDGHIVQI